MSTSSCWSSMLYAKESIDVLRTSTRQNVPSDILALPVESGKKRKNHVMYAIEITLYLYSWNSGLPNE